LVRREDAVRFIARLATDSDGDDVQNVPRAVSGDHVTTELDHEQFVLAYFAAVFAGTTPVFPPTTTVWN